MQYQAKNLEETRKVAESFVNSLVPKESTATVVGLYGNLGAGKTAFTKYVASVLGIYETITSPTFVIEKIYELEKQKFTHLIHIDAYRLKDSGELLHLGWNEILKDKNNLILIEWPEIVLDAMPEHIQVRIQAGDSEDSRNIEILSI
ncbi:MAG: tRNA (adenosine(37)-N6)-threonylcarbamoyltransferase complex ATPase subunit type 1 TsaE [Patescibacteria group bacterium]